MKRQNIIEKIRQYCAAHPFARVNSYKNIPHLCGIYVDDDGVVKICVELEDFEAHAEIHCVDGEFVARHTNNFYHLTTSQRFTVDRICDELTKDT